MFTIKSIHATIHDTGYGGYPYKVIVQVDVDSKAYNALPILRKAQSSPYGRRSDAIRDIGGLVLDVNNTLYAINPNIPAHNPSIDSNGGSRARNGVKTMEFVYFFKDHVRAEALGLQVMKLKNGDVYPKYGQYVNIAIGA